MVQYGVHWKSAWLGFGRGTTFGHWLAWSVIALLTIVHADKVPLPDFRDLKTFYPGYLHHGGHLRNHKLFNLTGVPEKSNLLIHDTSALRISYAFNKIGGVHSLGTELIRLSKYGRDSVAGHDSLQYIYLPIAFGPYLADKYGYPNISKVHAMDPAQTKHYFWGKQGILRVITYTVNGNRPKGHVALWDCDHFHQSKDWIAGNSLLTVEFWESPDTNCTIKTEVIQAASIPPSPLSANGISPMFNGQSLSERTKFIKNHLLPKNARHSSKKQREHNQ